MSNENPYGKSTLEISLDQAAKRDEAGAAATCSTIPCQPHDKELQALCDYALSLYGTRILDNIDLERLPICVPVAGLLRGP